jgi:glycosyltransferase involved in cell wall biosynthesis
MTSDRPRGRLAFVTPRYGVDVVGGSEAVMREAAHGFAARGWDVDLLTTCARDHYTWRNEYPAGATTIDGVVVHRFPIEPGSATRTRVQIERRIQVGEQPSFAEQLIWLDGLFRVPALFHHLVVHADDYDAVILSPYMWWTTVAGATVVPERTVVIPCLHDEPYARLELLHGVLAEPAALWFLSEPEHELAHRIAPIARRHTVTGAGVDVNADYDVDGFRKRFDLTRPYVLFAGRREHGKGWNWLLDAYRYTISTADLPLDLVTIGVGDVQVPGELAGRVIDLGFLDTADVANAFAAAAAYVQPSSNESFSRTIMEAWLAGTLVLATAQSEVLKWHCERSGAGLVFSDQYELAQCLSFIAAAPDTAQEMAERGRKYVLENYRWDIVLDAMERNLQELLCGSSS